jgi:hypothetical protein
LLLWPNRLGCWMPSTMIMWIEHAYRAL